MTRLTRTQQDAITIMWRSWHRQGAADPGVGVSNRTGHDTIHHATATTLVHDLGVAEWTPGHACRRVRLTHGAARQVADTGTTVRHADTDVPADTGTTVRHADTDECVNCGHIYADADDRCPCDIADLVADHPETALRTA